MSTSRLLTTIPLTGKAIVWYKITAKTRHDVAEEGERGLKGARFERVHERN